MWDLSCSEFGSHASLRPAKAPAGSHNRNNRTSVLIVPFSGINND
jgi:hypothetical protein